MSKGRGTIAYVDTDDDGQFRQIACLLELTPSGFERGVVESEACLGDNFVQQDSGDLRITPLTGAYVFTANEANIENALETAIINDSQMRMAIKFNYATPVYATYVGKLTRLAPRAVVRTEKYRREFTFQPTAVPTYSGTAPTAES